MDQDERRQLMTDIATSEVRLMVLGAITTQLRDKHDILNMYFTNYRVIEKGGVCPICESHEPISEEGLRKELMANNVALDVILEHSAHVKGDMLTDKRALTAEMDSPGSVFLLKPPS